MIIYIVVIIFIFLAVLLLIKPIENFDQKYQSIKLNPEGYWHKNKWYKLPTLSNSFKYYDVQRNCLRCERKTRSECDKCFNCGWYMINNNSNGLCLKRNASDLYENVL